MTTEMKTRLDAARNKALGPADQRTREVPELMNGIYTGGTAIERSPRAKPVKEGTRCFTLASSYQPPNRVMSPCAPGKMLGNWDDNQFMRRDILEVCLVHTLTQICYRLHLSLIGGC